MASSYPGGLDSFTNPTASDPLNSATVPHATQHANANDAIEAIQAELGTDPAGASATVKARFEAIEAAGWVTSTRILDGTIVDGDINAAAAIAQSKVANLTTDLAAKAPLASPTFTGTVTTPLTTAGYVKTDSGGVLSSSAAIAQADVTNLTSDLAGKAPSACLYISGAGGNNITCPDASGLDITGDIDIRVKLSVDDWSPSADLNLAYKADFASNSSYRFYLATTGALVYQWSANGSALTTKSSSANVSGTANVAMWLRVTHDVDNGASGNDVKFYTSTDDGATWTQLGTTQTTAGTTSIYSGNAALICGTSYALKLYRVQVLNGIGGTLVADWRGDIPAARYRDAYSNIWSVSGTSNAWMVA